MDIQQPDKKNKKLQDELNALRHSMGIQRVFSPLMLEFKSRDVLQVMVGATILAIPVSFTEETWVLGEVLPLRNVLGILLLSLVFISAFVYYNYYRSHFRGNRLEFTKRVVSTYLLSFIVVAVLLTLIEKAPWGVDSTLALKRAVLVALPASMSAAVADMIK